MTAARSGKPHSTTDRFDRKEFSEVDDLKLLVIKLEV